MEFHGFDLVCPACRSDLARRDATSMVQPPAPCDEALECVSCRHLYPVLLGIPDLRLWPDPYISMPDDRAKGRMLQDACRALDFTESVELYYRMTAAVPPFQARRFARSLLAAADRSAVMLSELECHTSAPERYDLLDIGCGTAPLLVAAARRQQRAIGVDVAFRWLVVAQKRLAEARLDVPLVCACAEALPFRDGTFHRVVGDSAIEHLRDQAGGLRECHRVLTSGGVIALTTPNGRSLGPDPHTGVPAGSWLPASFTAAYVRRKGGVPPSRHLLSAARLRQLLADTGFAQIIVDAPDVPPAQRASVGGAARAAIDAYHLIKRLPGGDRLVRAVGPLLRGTACKPERYAS